MEYSDDSVIRLPGGLPGFEDEHEFVLIDQPSHRPLMFFQSLRTPLLCFLALPVLSVDRSYRLAVSPEDLALLGLDTSRQPRIGEEVMCLSFIAAGEDRALSANLLSPVVINLKTRIAVQAIQTGCHYSHRHPLMVEEREPACSQSAGGGASRW
jgi:flagellar assembly factor FliW